MKTFEVEWPLHVGERFADTAFAGAVGKPLQVRLPDGRTVPGRLVAAAVVDDGLAAALTFEVADDVDLPGGDEMLRGLSLGGDGR